MLHKTPYRVFIGWDAAEMRAHVVAAASLRRQTVACVDVRRLAMSELIAKGLYTRPTRTLENGQFWDDISGAPMTTGHAIGRFFIPYLCGYEGWALFTDGDVLFRADVSELFDLADQRYAVQVVQQTQRATEVVKKSGQPQTSYARKNWSSVMLFNCGHPANSRLALDILNGWPGRDLHAFKWLDGDEHLGALPPDWNYLVGVTEPKPNRVALAHFTLGAPDIASHASDEFADEWHHVAQLAGYQLQVEVGA